MKKIIITGIIIISLFSYAIAQDRATLVIDRIVPIRGKLGFELYYTIKNEDSPRVFFKMTSSSFCEGLAYLEIVEYKSGKKENYFPCTGLIDLKSIVFNEQNSQLVKKDSSLKSAFSVMSKDLAPIIKLGKQYKIKLNLNYSGIPTESKILYFNKRLISKELIFTYKKW